MTDENDEGPDFVLRFDELAPVLAAIVSVQAELTLETINEGPLGTIIDACPRTFHVRGGRLRTVRPTPAASAAFEQGITVVREGDMTAAKDAFTRALELCPDHEPAATALAQVGRELGDYETMLRAANTWEIGRRLVDRGVLDNRLLAIEASHDELVALLRGDRVVDSAGLLSRAEWRGSTSPEDAPAHLGGTPSGPPPAWWLPEHARRSQRAVAAILEAMWHEPPPQVTATSVTGLPVSPGLYEGRARTVLGESDFGKL